MSWNGIRMTKCYIIMLMLVFCPLRLQKSNNSLNFEHKAIVWLHNVKYGLFLWYFYWFCTLFALSVKDQFVDYLKYINMTKRINHDRTVIFGRTTLLK